MKLARCDIDDNSVVRRSGCHLVSGALFIVICSVMSFAQTSTQPEKSREQAEQAAPAEAEAEGEEMFRNIYRQFYDTYRLGPRDEISIRVQAQPDYSLDKVKVSPFGRVYHPLLGEIEVAGYTTSRLQQKLTKDLSEYIKDPKVSVIIEQAQSAKLGVLGEVRQPGVVLLTQPLSLVDTIAACGGFTDTASRSDVTVLRRTKDGRSLKIKVNVKRVLDGKGGPEDDFMMQAGDTVLVDSNAKKKVTNLISLVSLASFVVFLSGGY